MRKIEIVDPGHHWPFQLRDAETGEALRHVISFRVEPEPFRPSGDRMVNCGYPRVIEIRFGDAISEWRERAWLAGFTFTREAVPA